MNKTRRKIIIIYCIAIALVCIVVPWKAEIKGASSTFSASLGYSVIWSPPAFGTGDPGDYSSVDYSRLIVEIIALTALAIMALVFTMGSKKEENNT